MSITFSVSNFDELVSADLSEEAKKARDAWYCTLHSDDDGYTKWEAYNKLVAPIEGKYELNMSNSHAKELFYLIELEFNCSGTFQDGELVIFINRLKELKSRISNNPVEYSTSMVESQGENGCYIILCKKAKKQ